MQPVDGTEHSCPSSAAGQDEPQSTEVQRAKRRPRPGVAAIEYCLLLSLILVFLIIAAQSLGLASKGVFQRMATIFASDGANADGDDQKAAQGDDDDDGDRGGGKGKGKGKGGGKGGGKDKGGGKGGGGGKGKGKGR